jgi:WD40 repeat protein
VSDPENLPTAASTALLEWVDVQADGFEASWRHGPPPALAAFLAGVQGPRRTALLKELVLIDLEYRWRGGERRKVEDYLRDFPELREPDGSLPDSLVLRAREIHDRCGAGFQPASREGRLETCPTATSPATDVCCPLCGHLLPPAEAPSGPVAGPVACPDCKCTFRLAPPRPPAFADGDLPRTLGKFQLLEVLGQGSFGTVYRARDAELGRTVAVKVPRSGAFGRAEDRERFLREARSAALLSHPHIVKVHEIGHEGDLPYLVSDFIAGRTLADVAGGRPLAFTEAAELTARIAAALDYAHRRKVVHRDINPRNILVDAGGEPHVTDFGLARREEGDVVVTLDGQILGTPAYMAPEQAAGEPAQVDGRSDVYSLGVVLYELLTGELPFRGQLRMLLHQVIHDEPRPPRQLNDHIPRDLETICLKAMAKSPARRYGSAGELAADLRRYLKGEPILARPVGRLERLWRWGRRNPIPAGLTATLLLLVAAVVIGTTVAAVRMGRLARQEGRARADAERSLRQAQESLSLLQASRGVVVLEGKDALGLLDLLDARKKAEELPGARESRSRLWSGWHAAYAGRLVQVMGHDAAVTGVAFAPRGTRLVTGARDATAQLWDWATGLPVGEPFARNMDFPDVTTLAFSPDGRRLAYAQGRTVRLRDTATGRAVGPVFKYPADVHRLAFSPDGRWLAVWATDESLELREAATGLPHRHLGRNENVRGVTFSPDGRRLAAYGGSKGQGLVRVWDVATGREQATMRGHQTEVYALAFSPDGTWLATGAWDHTARVWDTATGKPRTGPLAHGEDVHAVAVCPRGKLLATASFDGTARLWEPDSGRLRWELRHGGPVITAAFSPDGKWLATGSFDGSARLWDTATGRLFGWPLRHQGVVSAVAFSPDGRLLATASADGTARLWAVDSSQPRSFTHQDRVWGVAFSPDGKRLASGSEDGLAWIWDVPSGKPRRGPLRQRLADSAGLPKVLAVAISPDGKYLATVGNGVQVWDVATGRARVFREHPGSRAVAFSPDGKRLASAGYGIRLWEPATGKSLRQTPLQERDYVEAVAFSPDSQLLAGAGGKAVHLWEAATGRPHRPPLRHQGAVEAVAFSPDGKWLATASRDLTVRLWDTGTWELHGQPFRQTSFVQALAFSPDSELLATAAADGTARLLDPSTGLACGPALPHRGFATAAAFSPDGKWLATGSFDKHARLWPVPARVSELGEMELRTWVALGARLNREGVVQAIPWQEWRQLRDRLRRFAPGKPTPAK